ncbi:MAG TPA: J domain-containing protein [Vicinamibacteria bacterium]|nr:J domain-containing protein [Vicinamibacteria bacterium]
MATSTFVESGPEMILTRREILERHAVLAKQGHAQVLGLEPGADRAAVKEAYARLVRRYHPDQSRLTDAELREKAQAIFIRINEAFRALGASDAPTRGPRRSGGGPKEVPRGGEGRAASRATARLLKATATSSAGSADDDVAEGQRRRKRVERVEGVLKEAEALLDRRDSEGAVEALHEVLVQSEGPHRRRARLLLARAYCADSRWQRYAVQLLREMVQEAPEDADALALQGALFHREGLLARAETTLVRALASDPGHGLARAQLRTVRAARASFTNLNAGPKPRKIRLLARLLAWRA